MTQGALFWGNGNSEFLDPKTLFSADAFAILARRLGVDNDVLSGRGLNVHDDKDYLLDHMDPLNSKQEQMLRNPTL